MRTIRNLGICLLLLLSVPLLLSAQNVKGHSVISLQAGPSTYVGTFLGIGDYSGNYRSDLRGGLSWNASYAYLFGSLKNPCNVGLGMLYQGVWNEHSTSDISDEIAMQYVAPQVMLHIGRERYNIQLAYGGGFLWYRDSGGMYGNSRKVDMDLLAFHLSVSGEYYLTSWCGICARLGCIVSESREYTVAYHGETWDVENPELSNGGGVFAPLSFTIGLNFHF